MSGTGKKFDNGKAPISLIPSETITGIAQVFAFGANKYGRHNFREGLAHSRVLDAALRHILAIVNGEDVDPESNMPHVYHALCSLAMYDWQRLHHPEMDDRYKEPRPLPVASGGIVEQMLSYDKNCSCSDCIRMRQSE
jgi:hypothetical protein